MGQVQWWLLVVAIFAVIGSANRGPLIGIPLAIVCGLGIAPVWIVTWIVFFSSAGGS